MGTTAQLFGLLYEKGDVVFSQGDSGGEMYIIQSGVVEVSRMRGDRKVVLTLLEKGDFFGEIALLDQRPRSASVSAVTRTRLLPLSRAAFLKHASYNAQIVLYLLKAISRRIDRMTRQVRETIEADEELREAVFSGKEISVPSNGPSGPAISGIPENRTAVCPGGDFREPLPEQVRSFPSSDALLQECYDAGQLIFEEGQEGHRMYFIAEGTVEIFQEEISGRCPLGLLGPGDFFGEMAVITEEARTASAAALTPVKLRPILRDEVLASIQTDPETGLFFLQLLISRLRTITRALEDPQKSLQTLRRSVAPRLKKTEKISAGISSLSSCGGCTTAFVQSSDVLDGVLKECEIRYCPMLMDQEEIKEVQIAMLDGAVRTREDEDKLREIRQKCRFLVAWGTCAVFGGIPALANDYELEELLEESYGNTLDLFSYYLAGSGPPMTAADYGIEEHLLRRTRKISDVVKVDYYLPGCPPPIVLIQNLLLELQGRNPAAVGRVVCAECPRKATKTAPAEVKAFPDGSENGRACFLSLGVLCLGVLTRGGCRAACTGGGLPCWGCRGPTSSILTRINRGERFEAVLCQMLSRRMKIDRESLEGPLQILRQRCGSALSFERHFVRDTSKIR